MASYKQPCAHCGEFIERESRTCPKCGRAGPFGYQCPTCFKPIQKGDMACSGCGRSLKVECPACGKQTFVGSKCDECGASLMILCTNPNCGQPQFFENTKCTICGKKIKTEKKDKKEKKIRG